MTKKNVLKGLVLTLFLNIGNTFGQYNMDYKILKYKDQKVLKSSVEIGDGGLITVGTVTVPHDFYTNEDIVLTHLDEDGNVLWSKRYGQIDQREVGHGIALSSDRNHVIIAGSVIHTGGQLTDAMVLKVRIDDGTSIWTKKYGSDEHEEKAFVIKQSNSEPFYVITGHVDNKLAAFKIDDAGNLIWSKRYVTTCLSSTPTSMISDNKDEFIIAGTYSAGIGVTGDLFTVGIRKSDGTITRALKRYTIAGQNAINGCAITKTAIDKGYALAYTLQGEIGLAAPFDRDCIGVLRLDNSWNTKWANVYWQGIATGQQGLSINHAVDVLKVCTNLTKNTFNTPALLTVKDNDGTVDFCHTYHIPSTVADKGPKADAMIAANDGGYFIKSIYNNRGFMITKTDALSISTCYRELTIQNKGVRVESNAVGAETIPHNFMSNNFAHDLTIGCSPCPACFGCDEERATSIDSSPSEVLSNKQGLAVVYPSPISEKQTTAYLKFTSTLSNNTNAQIVIYTATGQAISTKSVALINGVNNIKLETSKLSKGLHLVVITTAEGVLDQVKFVKE